MKIADISVYQGDIDWEKARKELEMVIFRASVGNKKDTKYVYNAKNCNIPFGVYHYYKAGNKEEAEQETKFFYESAIQESLSPLFFCLDIEYKTQTKETTKIICETALSTLKNLGAKKVGLYIGQSRYPYIKEIKDKFDFIWIPRYGKDTGSADENYKPVYYCDLWQYTSKGRVNGINGDVDLNKIYGNKTLEWFIDSNYFLITNKITNIYKSDDKNYDVITTVNAGEKLIPVLDRNKNPIMSKNNWYAVRTVEHIGWIPMENIG